MSYTDIARSIDKDNYNKNKTFYEIFNSKMDFILNKLDAITNDIDKIKEKLEIPVSTPENEMKNLIEKITDLVNNTQNNKGLIQDKFIGNKSEDNDMNMFIPSLNVTNTTNNNIKTNKKTVTNMNINDVVDKINQLGT